MNGKEGLVSQVPTIYYKRVSYTAESVINGSGDKTGSVVVRDLVTLRHCRRRRKYTLAFPISSNFHLLCHTAVYITKYMLVCVCTYDVSHKPHLLSCPFVPGGQVKIHAGTITNVSLTRYGGQSQKEKKT